MMPLLMMMPPPRHYAFFFMPRYTAYAIMSLLAMLLLLRYAMPPRCHAAMRAADY